MATNTPTLVMRKPDPTDLVDVVTDLGANFDKIDAAFIQLAKRNRLRVSRNVAQAVGHNVASAIVWTTREYDTSPGQTMWNPSAGTNSKLVAPVAGCYHFEFGAQFSINGTAGARCLYFIKGGIPAIEHFYPNTAWYPGGVITMDFQLAAGEFIECMAYHTAGVVLNLDIVYSIWATMSLVAII